MIAVATGILRAGGIVVYPTDTTYAVGCHIGDKHALQRIISLRRLAKNHQFTLACRDLSELGSYARVDNADYRLIKRITPGPFTFILRATREVPRRLVHDKRRTIGIRVPNHPVTQALLDDLQQPLMSTTLRMPDEEEPLVDGEEIFARVGKLVDAVIDIGVCGQEVSTVLDLTGPSVHIIRQGLGIL